jgi:hypothetical protein
MTLHTMASALFLTQYIARPPYLFCVESRTAAPKNTERSITKYMEQPHSSEGNNRSDGQEIFLLFSFYLLHT